MASCTILEEKKSRQASISSFFGVISKKRKPVQDATKSTKRPKKKLEQMYLDLGQRDFGKHMHCHTCGMMYVHGVEEDVAAHAKMCDDFQNGVRLTPTPALRTLTKYSADECIIEIRPTDSRTLRNKLAAVLDVVQRELSFVTADSETKQQPTAFLYIVKNRVVGLVMAETIQEAFVYHKNKGNNHSERSEAVMGIVQLWVHSDFRRQGFASRLVNAAREHLIFGMNVPVQQTAFSSPTQSGMGFAQRYGEKMKAEKVLVYNCSSIRS